MAASLRASGLLLLVYAVLLSVMACAPPGSSMTWQQWVDKYTTVNYDIKLGTYPLQNQCAGAWVDHYYTWIDNDCFAANYSPPDAQFGITHDKFGHHVDAMLKHPFGNWEKGANCFAEAVLGYDLSYEVAGWPLCNGPELERAKQMLGLMRVYVP